MNSVLARSVLRQLAKLGVREVCMAAGARNTPLITALLASSGVKLWNFFEERSAGFFALGRMMESRRPVAVVTTSGTAAAELLPAVIEAFYQAQPLIVVTADRPSHYRGSGAPQAIEQVGLFGGYAEPTVDLELAPEQQLEAIRLGIKPLHLNVCFDEPLLDGEGAIDFNIEPTDEAPSLAVETTSAPEHFLAHRDGLVVLAAGLHPQEAAALQPCLEQLGVPVVAEATANLQSCSCLVRGGEKALKALAPRRVLRLGSVPSWRWWRDLEDRPEVPVMHLSNAPFAGLARDKTATVLPLRSLLNASIEVDQHHAASIDIGSSLQQTLAAHPLSEPAWMQHLSQVIPSGSRVFLGNSLPIREFNLAGSPAPRSSFYANRGANGIDGLVSTFYGIVEGAEDAWLIVGDLSSLYDLSGPWIAKQLSAGNRRIAIINNGGGKIFSRVAALQTLPANARDRLENTHDIKFDAWAQLWQMPYRCVMQPEDLLHLPAGDLMLEIVPSPEQTEAFWAAWK